jgi:hypothetical protein
MECGNKVYIVGVGGVLGEDRGVVCWGGGFMRRAGELRDLWGEGDVNLHI